MTLLAFRLTLEMRVREFNSLRKMYNFLQYLKLHVEVHALYRLTFFEIHDD